jgi:glycosyltransferase involved in cell wall biosynthesis
MVLARPPDTSPAASRTHTPASGAQRDVWIKRNWYYHREIQKICRRFVPPRSRVLVVGSQTGDILSALDVDRSNSVAVDSSEDLVEYSRKKHPEYRFEHGEPDELEKVLEGTPPFDYIVLPDLIGLLDDLQRTFVGLHAYCHSRTKVMMTSYNFVWEPVVTLGEKLGMKMPQPDQNWLSTTDVASILTLSEFHVDVSGAALLLPLHLPLGDAINRFASRNRLLRHLCLIQYVAATYQPPDPAQVERREALTVSVVVPCRNEAGNIEAAVRRIPEMGRQTEIIFIDGESTDGTVEKIEEMIASNAGRDIKLIHQVPRGATETTSERPHRMLKLGKGDAVRKAFAAAKGDVLMILDADLTVPPEDLPKFFFPLSDGLVEFANGCRLVYPMQDEAMRSANLIGNRFFGLAFSWLLGQPVKDTLCGTKALFKRDYEAIVANRSYFGEFDPFGDFDLLFGAARLRLKIGDIPIRYRRRVAGQSKVSVLRHGILLARMTLVGFYRLKLLVWLHRSRPTAPLP